MRLILMQARGIWRKPGVSRKAYSTNPRSIYTLDPIDPNEPKFSKILIANRGEIACRVISTCKAMGIKTVAVYSDADAKALHVKLADEAVNVGPPPTKDSYLRMDKILEAVKSTGAQAVHPGYGFLSENTEFARLLTEAGGTFIGPNSKAIRAMGDKIESKRIASAANVNMIPGYDGEIKDEDECVKASNQIGYPVMIKASAGGGGKGMRVARNDKQAREGFRLSKQEAASSFGDDRMLVEKFVDNPRHIEMQIISDKHGNAIWLNERECSIQRRNQKVIEEAPSPFVDPEMRRKMGEQATALALHVGYDSAGTVEFLVDSHSKNFFFLEMNTRLQVEHPITEGITGLDLVQQMVRVAYGHKLNVTQEQIGINGWAMECRVYAEDPYKGFGLPSVGRLNKYREPKHVEGVRCDSGIREGSEISIYYDALICKLVTYGKDRLEAIRRMQRALDQYVIRGVTHNVSMLRDIMGEKRFQSGDLTTAYLPETYPEGFQGTQLTPSETQKLLAVAAVIKAQAELRNYGISGSGAAPISYKYNTSMLGKEKHIVEVFMGEGQAGSKVIIDGISMQLDAKIGTSEVLDVQVEVGNEITDMCTQIFSSSSHRIDLIYKGSTFGIELIPHLAAEYNKYMLDKPKPDMSSVTIAPMPGLIKSIAVIVGQAVTEGMELVVMEAMKMQNSLTAVKTGKVKAVNVKEGQTVDEGNVLVELE